MWKKRKRKISSMRKFTLAVNRGVVKKAKSLKKGIKSDARKARRQGKKAW